MRKSNLPNFCWQSAPPYPLGQLQLPSTKLPPLKHTGGVIVLVVGVLVNVTAKSILHQKKKKNLFFRTGFFSYYLLQSAAEVTAGPDGPKHKHAKFVPKLSVSRQANKVGEAIHGLFAGFDRLQIPKRFQIDILLLILIVSHTAWLIKFRDTIWTRTQHICICLYALISFLWRKIST